MALPLKIGVVQGGFENSAKVSAARRSNPSQFDELCILEGMLWENHHGYFLEWRKYVYIECMLEWLLGLKQDIHRYAEFVDRMIDLS